MSSNDINDYHVMLYSIINQSNEYSKSTSIVITKVSHDSKIKCFNASNQNESNDYYRIEQTERALIALLDYKCNITNIL